MSNEEVISHWFGTTSAKVCEVSPLIEPLRFQGRCQVKFEGRHLDSED
jgi:hypothetical protein